MQRTAWLLALALAFPVGVLFARTSVQHAPGAGAAAASGSASGGAQVVAWVNGKPITLADVDLRLRGEARGKTPPAERRTAMLEQIVSQELLAQRAHELGLDADPKYVEESADADAQIGAYKRRRLADLTIDRELVSAATPTDADAKKYFDDNLPKLKGELHIVQIFRRGRAAIDSARDSINAGKSFDDVAKVGLEESMPGMLPPWDLGWVRWLQLPDPIREAAANLKPGEVSGVISGPGERFWIIKLVERREDDKVSFDLLKPRILELLRNSRLETSRAALEKDLRAKAKITYAPLPK
jgi:hypothetical protein